MGLPTEGKIRFPRDINAELGAPLGTARRFRDPEVLELIGKTAVDAVRFPDDFYGASANPKVTAAVGKYETYGTYGTQWFGVILPPVGSLSEIGSWLGETGYADIGLAEGYSLGTLWAKRSKNNDYWAHHLRIICKNEHIHVVNSKVPRFITVHTYRGSLTFERYAYGSPIEGVYSYQYNQTIMGTYSPIIIGEEDRWSALDPDSALEIELELEF